jgi:hypothetical protein
VRNDARPVGEGSPASPIGGDEVVNRETDSRDRHTHDRQSHIVHPRTEDDARRKDLDIDPTMPTGDSTLNTKI